MMRADGPVRAIDGKGGLLMCLRRKLQSGCTLAWLVWVGIAAAQAPDRPLGAEQVADGLFLITGEGGNVAAYVTGAGVVLVDNMFYRNFDAILAQVASITDQPITYALNTHQHDDHAGGNARMLRIADVIAHENVWLNLSDIQQPYYEDTPGTPIGLPNVTFTDELVLHPGGKEIRAKYFGRGHTSGDVVVYFPGLRAIHTGDLFLGRRSGATDSDRPPGVNIYVDYAQGGSFLEWTDTLDAILELDFDTIIPGHGPVSTRADLIRFRADLEAMRDRIAALIQAGASKEQVLAVFEMDYGWRSTGCPPSPPTPGCLQFQQMDALIRELSP
jgi:glyoxylase-like metal-dependent hydrolase (beta-lactamase superfamily II)